jgi:hypothetical protein
MDGWLAGWPSCTVVQMICSTSPLPRCEIDSLPIDSEDSDIAMVLNATDLHASLSDGLQKFNHSLTSSLTPLLVHPWTNHTCRNFNRSRNSTNPYFLKPSFTCRTPTTTSRRDSSKNLSCRTETFTATSSSSQDYDCLLSHGRSII